MTSFGLKDEDKKRLVQIIDVAVGTQIHIIFLIDGYRCDKIFARPEEVIDLNPDGFERSIWVIDFFEAYSVRVHPV